MNCIFKSFLDGWLNALSYNEFNLIFCVKYFSARVELKNDEILKSLHLHIAFLNQPIQFNSRKDFLKTFLKFQKKYKIYLKLVQKTTRYTDAHIAYHYSSSDP